MRIKNHGLEILPEREYFERVCNDIERRAPLPDIDLFRTFNSGMRWNNLALETISVIHPTQPTRHFHFAITRKQVPGCVFHAILCSTLDGAVKWFSEFETHPTKVSNLSFEVVKFFLEQTGRVKVDRELVELLYPAYGLTIPPLPVLAPGQRPAIRNDQQTVLPDITQE